MFSTEVLRRAIQTARAGSRAEARDLFMQVVETDPQADSLLAEAQARAEQNELDTALHLARQAVQLQPRSEHAWLLIARLSPDIDQQIEALANANQLNPANPEIASA